MSEITITPLPNGPYYVTGNVKLIDGTGREIEGVSEKMALCRCGESSNKPFCDGTHKKIGFTTEPG